MNKTDEDKYYEIRKYNSTYSSRQKRGTCLYIAVQIKSQVIIVLMEYPSPSDDIQLQRNPEYLKILSVFPTPESQ